MRVKVIAIIVDVFGTVTRSREKGLEELEISGRILTNQKATLLISAKILRIVLEIEGVIWTPVKKKKRKKVGQRNPK